MNLRALYVQIYRKYADSVRKNSAAYKLPSSALKIIEHCAVSVIMYLMDSIYQSDKYRIDDLQRGGFRICQEKDGFCFGVDSVILSDFASKRIRNYSNVIDLCSGNGIIPILLYCRNSTLKITAVEIMEDAAQLADWNMRLNDISESVSVMHSDAKKLPEEMNGTFDALTVNPPYIKADGGKPSESISQSVSRHELLLSAEELIKSSAGLLKDKGKFFMVHRAHRIAELSSLMKKYSLEPKSLRFVYPRVTSDKAVMVLIYAVKGSGEWTDVEKPLYIHSGTEYTDEIYEIYGKDK